MRVNKCVDNSQYTQMFNYFQNLIKVAEHKLVVNFVQRFFLFQYKKRSYSLEKLVVSQLLIVWKIRERRRKLGHYSGITESNKP